MTSISRHPVSLPSGSDRRVRFATGSAIGRYPPRRVVADWATRLGETQYMAVETKSIFCLEGDWSRSIKSRQSVEPLLQLLQDCGATTYVHRDVATRAELNHYLDRWLARGMTRFKIGYLGFHGSRHTLHLSRNESITLSELADELTGRCNGRLLYFGSCSTLAVQDSDLQDFCRQTSARGVVGYTKDVDFVESAGFEIHMLTDLLRATNVRSAYNRLRKEHPVLTTRLGLRMAHATWASERSVAINALK